MYKIETNGKFDFSKYPKNSKFHGKSNKNVIVQIKDKTKGFPIVDLVGLKSKIYSYIEKDDTGNNKATGINKNVTEDMTQKECKNMLFEKKQMRCKMKRIQSKSHQ